MGGLLSRVMLRLGGGPKECKLLMLGLDNAGKTTTLYKLQLGESIRTVPTIGFNMEVVNFRNLEMSVWDVGGQDKLRALWRYYYEGSHGIVYIVDSTDDDERLGIARATLDKMLEEPCLRGAAVLVMANKQDAEHARSAAEVAKALGMSKHTGSREWYVQPTSALTGEGVVEGMDWLATQVERAM